MTRPTYQAAERVRFPVALAGGDVLDATGDGDSVVAEALVEARQQGQMSRCYEAEGLGVGASLGAEDGST